MDTSQLRQNTIRPIQLVIIVWLISVIWNVIYWYLYYQHYKVEINTYRLILLGLLDWSFWLVALPVVVMMAKKHPPVRLKSLFFLHVPMNLITTICSVMVSVGMRHLLETGTSVAYLQDVQNRLISEGSWYFLFYWFVVGAYFTVDYHAAYSRSQKQSLEFQLENENLNRRLIESRLSMLRAQLQPHFLFNSLHSISSLMDVSVPKARSVLIQLANLFRDALAISQKDVHLLSEEYHWIEQYLALESIRFQDHLIWHSEFQEKTLSATVPCLLLQPLLENVFKHSRKKKNQTLVIDIKADLVADYLMIELTDNGIGLKQQGQDLVEGNGLRYVREILNTHFGNDGTIEYSNNSQGGATFRIRMPYIEGKVNEQD
ncbi:sensor histidine kinase [Marinicella sp. W31]|uniref:sensor histidine kinase n=1 Tax=Marinicella sp. W31 TaxID=3023713 RepID=UPI003756E355